MDEFLILLQAKLDEEKSKGNVNTDIDKIQSQIDKLKIQAEIDPKTISNLVKQLEGILNQKINISNIGIETNNAVKAAQQAGQKIGNAINQGVTNTVSKASKTLKSFTELKIGTGNIDAIVDKNGLLDAEKSLNKIKQIYSEFGQVKITNKIFDPEGNLQQFRVDIQQVNGELKESRNFMMALSSDGKSFGFPQDVIKGSESFVHHLNEAKNISNATGEELNAQKEKLAEQEKYYAKLEQASKEQLAIEKQRITAGEKQLEILDAQSKRRDSRISYNEEQINKKGLTDISKQREINNLAYSGKEKLDTSFAREIDKNLSGLSKLKAQWQEQGIYIDELRAKVESLEKSLNEISVGDVKGLNSFKEQISSLTAEAKQLSQIHEIQLSMDNGHGASEYQNRINAVTASLEKYGVETKEAQNITASLQTTFDSMKGISGQELVDQADKLEKEFKSVKVSVEQAKLSYDKLMQPASKEKISSTLLKVQKLLSNNTKVTEDVKNEWQSYVNRLSSGSDIAVKEINDINVRLKETESNMRSMGKLGLSWTDKLKQAWEKFGGWGFATGTMMTVFNQIRQIPKEVIKVNSAMVELNKVSDASASDIIKYFDEAARSAKRYGSSVSDLISATADWSRLGYSLPDSKKLAEVATLYKNVGDGIDITTANESLVSTLQGFKLNADEAIHIIDAFNEVGNNFAIGSDGIGEALKRSASSMYAAGNTLEETIGLVTAANAVVQDPESIGTAYKTISMRIRGAKTEMEELGLETDGMVESTATLQKEIMALSGVDIMKDENTFKSTYQILDELATKWQYLTDIQQASITELIAGKRQGNIVSALMSNFETARQATETAVNSTGSALKEQEAYEQGIQYSLDRLEASFQTFANHILDSDFLKGIVDFGDGVINVIDTVINKLGSLGTIGFAGAGYGILAFIKNLDCQKALKTA